MILVELGRIIYAIPFVVTMLRMEEDSNIVKVSDLSEVLSNFFWIGLAINVSGHFSFFKTQLALKLDPERHKTFAEEDLNFQLLVDVLIGTETLLGLGLVILIVLDQDEVMLDSLMNTVLIFFTLIALTLIVVSLCKISKFFHNIPMHEKVQKQILIWSWVAACLFMLIVFSLSLYFAYLAEQNSVFTSYLLAMLLFFFADVLSIVNILCINNKILGSKKEYR